MAKGGIRVTYTTEHGWQVETGTGDTTPRTRTKSSHRNSQRRRASENPTQRIDVDAAFTKAHEWLNRVEEAVAAAHRKQAEASPASQPTEAEAAATDPVADETPPPPPDEPVELPDDPLEPLVPALKISFGSDGGAGPGGLPATRFGGQPDWLGQPQWPISRELGTPMQFVAQIALHPDQLAWVDEPKMAYLFESDDRDDPGGPATWEPFAGENALIVQPGTAPTWVELRSLKTGPSVGPVVPVTLTPQTDPVLLDGQQFSHLMNQDRAVADRFQALVDYDKLGGTPNFFQGIEMPDFETLTTSRELGKAIPIMMIRNDGATGMSVGDSGRAVSFLSPDQKQGAHLWYC